MPKHIDYTWTVVLYEQTNDDLLQIVDYKGHPIPRIHESIAILNNTYRVIDVCYDYDNGVINIKMLKTNE